MKNVPTLGGAACVRGAAVGGGTLDHRWPVDELSAGSTWGPLTIVARVGGGRYGSVIVLAMPASSATSR